MVSKNKLYIIIFESDTRAGKAFDVFLLWSILLSVLVAMVDSLPGLNTDVCRVFLIVEWFFTIVFTIEYFLRIHISSKPLNYIFSFWGFVDLIAIFPTYLSLFYVGTQYLIIVRVLRLLRVFRILKLLKFYKESTNLLIALKSSFYKISIFLSFIIALVVLLGALMYVVEGGEHGFTSIPQSIYWAIITITTVGYGDIVPFTIAGKFIASFTMIIGYAIIAVPTGIVSVEISKAGKSGIKCSKCKKYVDEDSKYCSNCGRKLEELIR